MIAPAAAPGSERTFVVEIDNRSDQSFVFDGDWFGGGGWRAGGVPSG